MRTFRIFLLALVAMGMVAPAYAQFNECGPPPFDSGLGPLVPVQPLIPNQPLQIYDNFGFQKGSVTPQGQIQNKFGFDRGRVFNGVIYDNYGFQRGRVDRQGNIYDNFGFQKGRIRP